MIAKKRPDLSEDRSVTYQAGPWFVRVNHMTRRCQATSGDYWFDVPRSEARLLLLRKVG